MRFGIPLLADRVAPRCTFADSLLLVTTKGRRIQKQRTVALPGTTWADLGAVLVEHEVQTLVCGGISPSTRESIAGLDVHVIDNVAGTSEEVLAAVRTGAITSGGAPRRDSGATEETAPSPSSAVSRDLTARVPVDCLDCRDRPCLLSRPCPYLELPEVPEPSDTTRAILEAAWDVAQEEERVLCRLAELVYFGLELGCHRLGVAFCEDLREPAGILTRVLRRFFEVVPAGCRLGGGPPAGLCRPSLLAAYLNGRETELNVLVGLCVGADTIFGRESRAPVTTVFVKDKSLANNPVGAVYSAYHLEEI
ncbi:MAG: DUF1847 domain-containing protein [Gemmatimonadota bacterium]|jgi:uncharacterized metal-binding protein